jgi:FKBP-type peptidyl-prolyl cis-trans isomerase
MRPKCLFAILVGFVVGGCGGPTPTTAPIASNPAGLTKLGIKDIKVGTGPKAAKGDVVVLQYEGALANGKVFDSNNDETKTPLSFRIGAIPPPVIQGMEEGVIGMQTGGERELSIPAAKAYGPDPNGEIPANSDLFFKIKALYVLKGDRANSVDIQAEKPGSGPAVKQGDVVTIRYRATLLNGRLYDEGTNYSYEVGSGKVMPAKSGRVLPALNVGVVGMKKGGTRTLICPPGTLYGAMRPPGIAQSDLLSFEIELLKIG